MQLTPLNLIEFGLPLTVDAPTGATVTRVAGGVEIRVGKEFALALYDSRTTILPSRDEMPRSLAAEGSAPPSRYQASFARQGPGLGCS
jgi:hypothetical protein